jgi:endonuclease YncB( thermonuclease family)
MDEEHRYMIVFIRFFLILFFLIAWVMFTQVAFGQSFECVVTRVIDGDTLEVFCPSRDPRNPERVRLIGLQTPEKGERRYYTAAWDLEVLSAGEVNVERFGKDRYGRTLGLVESRKGCVNVLMRKRYPDTKYDRLLTKKQRDALKEREWK